MEETKQEEQKMRTSTKWAIGITVVWLGGVAAYVIFKWDKFLTMDPNAIGDFLAGTISPLALFWLVAGYRQQGEALHAQLRELALQVESTKVIAESSSEQARVTRKMHEFTVAETERLRIQQIDDRLRTIKPIINLCITGRNENRLELLARNVGGDAFRLAISTGHYEHCFCPGDKSRLAREGELAVTLNNPLANKYWHLVTIRCYDFDGHFHVTSYEYDQASDSIITVVAVDPDSDDENIES